MSMFQSVAEGSRSNRQRLDKDLIVSVREMDPNTQYYKERLYPFQDAVLKLVNDLRTPFYLSGGTALIRCYFNQRYSDDLQFYVDAEAEYEKWLEIIFKALAHSDIAGDFSVAQVNINRHENEAQMLLKSIAGVELALTFINSKIPHFGGFTNHPRLGRVDSWQNILSNTLVALPRRDIHDFANAWIIAKNSPFELSEIMAQAKQKDAAIDSAVVSNLLKNIPVESLDSVKWLDMFDKEQFLSDINKMAENIQSGVTNSIFSVGWVC